MLLLDVIFTWFLLLCGGFTACFDSWCFLLVFGCGVCGVFVVGY